MGRLIRGMFRDSSIPVSVKRLSSDGPMIGVGGTPHSHDFTEIVVFVSGSADHFVNGERYRVGPGDAFVVEHVESVGGPPSSREKPELARRCCAQRNTSAIFQVWVASAAASASSPASTPVSVGFLRISR